MIAEVEAVEVNTTEIIFICPRCKPQRKNGKPILHRHGSGGNFSNRSEHRIAHCNDEGRKNCPEDGIDSFTIHITDNTKRKR
jgi:hypothetical protein